MKMIFNFWSLFLAIANWSAQWSTVNQKMDGIKMLSINAKINFPLWLFIRSKMAIVLVLSLILKEIWQKTMINLSNSTQKFSTWIKNEYTQSLKKDLSMALPLVQKKFNVLCHIMACKNVRHNATDSAQR
jgi:hypothetical protein